MSETSPARKRKRTIEDGRVVTNVAPEFGCYMARIGDDLGISPNTVARILIVEAITKHRGITREQLVREMEEADAAADAAAPLAV